MTIYEVLPLITAEVEAIGKSRKNTSQNYAFRGVDDVYSALNVLLGKHKVTIVPEVLEFNREERTSSQDKALFFAVMKVKYTFYAEDGSNVSAIVMGEAMDSGDKAVPKALSMAYKYMAFQVFCIPTEEKIDTEYDTHEVQSKLQVHLVAINSMEKLDELEKYIKDKGNELSSFAPKDKSKLTDAYYAKKKELSEVKNG